MAPIKTPPISNHTTVVMSPIFENHLRSRVEFLKRLGTMVNSLRRIFEVEFPKSPIQITSSFKRVWDTATIKNWHIINRTIRKFGDVYPEPLIQTTVGYNPALVRRNPKRVWHKVKCFFEGESEPDCDGYEEYLKELNGDACKRFVLGELKPINSTKKANRLRSILGDALLGMEQGLSDGEHVCHIPKNATRPASFHKLRPRKDLTIDNIDAIPHQRFTVGTYIPNYNPKNATVVSPFQALNSYNGTTIDNINTHSGTPFRGGLNTPWIAVIAVVILFQIVVAGHYIWKIIKNDKKFKKNKQQKKEERKQTKPAGRMSQPANGEFVEIPLDPWKLEHLEYA